jgi:hypothetical protein
VKILLAIVVGAGCAAIVACGAARSKAAMPPTAAMPGPGGNDAHARIDELDQAITTELANLNLPRPAAASASVCTQPPCDVQPLAVPVKPTTDPACKPGPSDHCKDSCRFADSICDNAGKICEIAGQLGGNDAYANEKCGSGKASCDAAGAACCSCQL